MAEQFDTPATAESRTAPARRRLPDPLALVVGLVSLGVAGFAVTGQAAALNGFDARWLLAGAAVLLGVLLLIGSLRRN